MQERLEPLNASRIAWIAAISYAVIAAVVGTADIAFILRHYTKYPFGDQWIWLARFAEGGLSRALFSQYNEHRLVFPGLLYWMDLRFFDGKNAFLTGALVAINIACIVVLLVPFARCSELPKPVRLVFFGFVTILMLWYIQGPNFFYPYQICMPLANLGIVSSLYLFTVFSERSSGGDWLLASSILCGFIASFSYGHGLLIWPLLLLIAVILRLRVRQWAPVAVAGCLAAGLYFWHYATPASHANPVFALLHPVRLAKYFFLMIGLPWMSGENADLAWQLNLLRYGIIAVGLAVAVYLICLFVFRRLAATRFILFYSSLVLLAIGSVAITALGRSTFPLAQSLSGRYAPIPLMFWISLIALLTVTLCRLETLGGAGRFLWCLGLAAISIATIPTQFAMGSYMAGREQSQRLAADSIAVGAPDQKTVGVELYSALPLIKFSDLRIMQTLHHPSLFQNRGSSLLGAAVQSHFQISGQCDGSVDVVRLYQGDQTNAVALSGWLCDRRNEAIADKILVTDEGGVVQGIGIGDFPRPDVAATRHEPALQLSGWAAYAKLPAEGSRQLRVFGEFPNSTAVCELVSPKTLIAQ